MAYKILYLEDLEPGSIVHDLTEQGFIVTHLIPTTFEDVVKVLKDYDLLLFDFRLTESVAIFDAPTVAQNIRTKNSKFHYDIPIVLISSEEKISDYYKDYSSQDLFDLSLSKKTLLEQKVKYAHRFISLIKGYQKIKEAKFNSNDILAIDSTNNDYVDYRIVDKMSNDILKDDVFACATFVLNDIIRTVGTLIGEDVLAARLGIDKKSDDWNKLLEHFTSFQYKGIFSDSYNRWWADGLIDWWKKQTGGSNNLRSVNAEQRKTIIIKNTGLNLVTAEKTKYAKSTSFWTICRESFAPLDPIDGLELKRRELLPWQDQEFISLEAGVEPKTFDSTTGLPFFVEKLKPIDRSKLNSFLKSGANGNLG